MRECLPFSHLVNAGLMYVRDSINQMDPRRPNWLIRSYPGDIRTFDEAKNLQADFISLSKDYCVRTALVDVVFGADDIGPTIFIVVNRINGENLREAFKHPTPDMIEKYQTMSIGLTRYMVDRAKSGSNYLIDITSLNNFMYGTINAGEERQIYLTDLECDLIKFQPDKYYFGNAYHQWLSWFAFIVNHVIEAEHLGNVRLPKVRKELRSVLDNPPLPGFNPKALNYLKNLLKSNKRLDSDYLMRNFRITVFK